MNVYSLFLAVVEGFNAPIATSFGEYCFSNCTSIITVTAPSLLAAGSYCFSYTTSSTHYSFPSLTECGSSCFEMMYDTDLTNINLPVATIIGSRSFYGCFALNTINIPLCTQLGPDNSVGDGMFYYIEHGRLFTAVNESQQPLGFYPSIQLGLDSISDSTFNSTTGRFSVTIPDLVVR